MANPTPTPDHDANLFARAARHLAAERDEKARVVLAALTGGGQPEVTELRLKAGLPIDKALRSRGLLPRECHRVHITDQWRCCYCGRFLINTRVLECIALLAGNDVCPYVNDHYRGPQETTDPATWITHPAIRRHAVQVEHVRPRSREQDTNRPENLRSVCVKCNEWKGERYLHEMPELVLRDRVRGWTGLEHLLAPLAKRVALLIPVTDGSHPVAG